jgi:hypothetical protein
LNNEFAGELKPWNSLSFLELIIDLF